MRILYLHQYFCPPGGSGNNRSYELARQWTAAGHEVTILTSPAYFPDAFKKDEDQYAFAVDGIQVVVLNVDYHHEMGFSTRIRSWIKFYRMARKRLAAWTAFDLIYASSTPLTVGELGRRLSRQTGIPYVFETVDVWPDVPIGMGVVKNPLLIKWLHRKTNRIYKEAAAIVSLSEGMRDQVLSHGVPKEKVYVIHNGTHPAAFPYVERPLRPGAQVIYTGTVGKANGLHHLVDAAAALEREGRKDIHFTVVGQGNDLDRVKVYAQELALTNLVFRDRVPKEEVHQLLADADIGMVCFATHAVLEANSANKFYDYLSAGLPVVLNYQGWQAEYLEEHGGGLAAPQGDLDALVANIVRLADDPVERRSMGLAGRSLVVEKFDRTQLADQLLDLFKNVLA